MNKLFLITGPTASGKSNLAIKIAKEHNGAIINADSMQIYKELNILTARPTQHDMDMVPHCLYGIISGKANFSVGQWLKLISKNLDYCKKQMLTPIIVGGTGLYFKALEQGLSQIPDIPNEIREKLRLTLEKKGLEQIYQELKNKDPQMAEKINSNDQQRILRSLEVLETTGKSILVWQRQKQPSLIEQWDKIKYIVQPKRNFLYENCNKRFDLMLQQGAISEVEELNKLNIESKMPIMKVIGVQEITRYLKKEISLIEAKEQAKTATRRYAKRQLTWFRNQLNHNEWKTLND